MNHLKWMGHATTIYEMQRNLRHELETCEVSIVAKGNTVRAHRFVLSTCSDLLRQALENVPIGEEAKIIVPEIRGSLLESVIAFIYLGETNLTSADLTEFLEAINVLGIKSAISFECNTTLTSGPNNCEVTTIPLKNIGDLQIVHEELLDQDNITNTKINNNAQTSTSTATTTTTAATTTSTTRDLEFLDVYNDTQNKITYSIQHVDAPSTDYILTENAGTYQITQYTNLGQNKLNTNNNLETVESVETVDPVETDEHIIDEYSNSADPLLDIAAAAAAVANEDASNNNVISNNTISSTNTTGNIHIKQKLKLVKQAQLEQEQQKQREHEEEHEEHEPTEHILSDVEMNDDEDDDMEDDYDNNDVDNDNDNDDDDDDDDDDEEEEEDVVDENVEVADDVGVKVKKEHIKTKSGNSIINNIMNNESVIHNTTDCYSAIADMHTLHENALDLAEQAVLNEGISLQKAAQKFIVSKTVLWRRVCKNPNYMKTSRENPVLKLAYERLKEGDSLKNISQQLHIPMSTLHRHKVRLAEQGRLPKYITFKKRDSLTKDQIKEKLTKAVHACLHDGMSQNKSANLYDIPKSTLWRHLQKHMAEANNIKRRNASHVKEEIILS